MPSTMYWQAVRGAVHVVVHTPQDPSDEDWQAYLEDVTKHAAKIKGILVYTQRTGPSASQRAASNKAFSETNGDMKVAIMTSSRMTKGIVTALSWVVGGNIKAFSTKDFQGAVASLGLDYEETLHAKVALKTLARAAGISIDAFADESGRYQR
ncbi:hypothetical protein G6O69_05755 [Pseudenhygromyxa sp. WMMC2535]|uniref:hypothetical protein n=1 Tax=Pseudenhygromyxa sp. WMMC2535 TaxID=2712867 RepID=UPI001553CFBD|nr:hypothetical protein [Pseudenhygromyxa sp. WMMC2535]NVB37327.1 hypothetical protein [Pseudenhygromyxa sp. WMMC2535]